MNTKEQLKSGKGFKTMSIFKSYDVRGIYPNEINGDIAFKIGSAFSEFLNFPKSIVVARDMRNSSDLLYDSLIKGIVNQGVNVVNLGVVSTPLFYFAMNFLRSKGGIIITASHNPGKYNGMKFVKEFARPISGATGIKEIEKKVIENNFKIKDKKGIVQNVELLDAYIEYVKTYSNNISNLKVVIDSGNGIAGKIVPKLLKNYDIELIELYSKLDGSFPNHDANPFNEENLIDLKNKIIETNADVGFAFDGDNDRIVMVDEKGKVVRGDILTALIAKQILLRRKEKIMYDLRCSKSVREVIKDNGGTPVISRVGHSYIKQKMRNENIYFAGEISGHYYFKDNFYTDSAVIPLLFLLSYISKEIKKVSELVSEVSGKYFHSGEINKEVKDPKIVFERIKQNYSDGKQSFLDGITVEYFDFWFNVRKSNTEPLMRLNLEANNKELMKDKVKEILQLFY